MWRKRYVLGQQHCMQHYMVCTYTPTNPPTGCTTCAVATTYRLSTSVNTCTLWLWCNLPAAESLLQLWPTGTAMGCYKQALTFWDLCSKCIVMVCCMLVCIVLVIYRGNPTFWPLSWTHSARPRTCGRSPSTCWTSTAVRQRVSPLGGRWTPLWMFSTYRGMLLHNTCDCCSVNWGDKPACGCVGEWVGGYVYIHVYAGVCVHICAYV